MEKNYELAYNWYLQDTKSAVSILGFRQKNSKQKIHFKFEFISDATLFNLNHITNNFKKCIIRKYIWD